MAAVAKRHKIRDETPSTSKKSRKINQILNAAENSGEFSTDWDVDDYRTEYESEEHWELRRSFMVAHKDRFDEERLVCLAQTFINMEFMGCKYPSDVMLLVAELSKDIAEEFRKSRALRLKRTFVSASDAAEQRAKGRRGAPASATATASGPASVNNKRDKRDFQREHKGFGTGKPIDLYEGLPYGNLVIVLAGGRSCLRNACTTINMKYEERICEDKSVEICINDKQITSGKAETLKAAKQVAFKQALLLLQSNCYSIKINASRATIKVDRKKDGMDIKVTKQTADNSGETKLDTNNKGYNMMRLMGWTGGGLGRFKQGREEPVGYLFKSNRKGLGAKDPGPNLGDYRKLIENYVNSDDMRDMQFEPTFSKEDRAFFHQIAGKYGLRSSSYGQGEQRRLLITKKISNDVILKEVLIKRNPKFCERYFVQVPMQKAHLFSGHVASLDLENMMD